MATIRLQVTVKRLEGRRTVDDSEVAAQLANAVEKIGRFMVGDRDDCRWLYEVNRCTIVTEQTELIESAPVEAWYCAQCGRLLAPRIAGRRRIYCDDACRQAAYRDRHTPA
jgi:hypothetical protein